MSGLRKYFCTGFSPRFGYWITDAYECLNMEAARKRFLTQYPTLKTVKVYPLRTAAESME
jgi:hypothetical protein